MNALISVIVPVFRVEKLLSRCVDSILAQSYKSIEIILVDDGSDDNCPAICDRYALMDDRIVVIHKKNGGLSDARNTGIKAAKGKYITFIDSDDSVEPNYIQQLYSTIVEAGADIAVCGYTVILPKKEIAHSSSKKMILNQSESLEKILYHQDFDVASVAKLYKKSLFRTVKFPVGENYEDSSTTYRLIMLSKTVSCNMNSQYNYIVRNNSIMTHDFKAEDALLVKSWDKMGEAIVERFPNLNRAAIRGSTYARICTLRKAVNASNRNKELEKRLRKEIINNKTILFDKKCPKRDKIAIVILFFGITPFRISWRIYTKATGRIV